MEKREDDRQLRKAGKESTARVGRTNINPDAIDERQLETIYSRHCCKDEFSYKNRKLRLYGRKYLTLDWARKLQDNSDESNVEQFYASSIDENSGSSSSES